VNDIPVRITENRTKQPQKKSQFGRFCLNQSTSRACPILKQKRGVYAQIFEGYSQPATQVRTKHDDGVLCLT
ncbi:MAG: hypothetical protein ACC634_10690, partial [Hyphomicrobiales bacterium]